MTPGKRWPVWRVRLAYLGRIAVRVLWRGDTTTIRVLMWASSIAFAIGLLPWFKTFDRPAFAVMSAIMPPWLWITCFLAHAAGLTWRFIEPKPRRNWAFAINAFGWALWTFYVVLTTIFVGEYTPSTAMEIVVLLAAFVALCRTAKNDEILSP